MTNFWSGNPKGRVRALVTGVGGNVGQGILKALTDSGLASHVVGTDCNALSVGLYATDRGYVVPPAGDPAFLPALLDIVKKESIRIVFVGADAETLALSQMRGRIESKTGAVVVVADPDTVERCDDKLATAAWFALHAFPFAASARADDREAISALVETHGFPLVVKPRRGFAARGVEEVRSESELETAAAKLGDKGIVQEYIGTADSEFTAAVFCKTPGRVDAAIVLRRELLQGTSYRIGPAQNQSLIDHVRVWGAAIAAKGPLNFQFRLTDDGPKCFEVNARFSGTTGVRFRFGYNDVSMAVRAFVFGDEIVQPDVQEGVVMRYWEEFHVPGLSWDRLSTFRAMVDGRVAPDDTEATEAGSGADESVSGLT